MPLGFFSIHSVEMKFYILNDNCGNIFLLKPTWLCGSLADIFTDCQ